MLIPYGELIRKYNINPTGVLHVGAHWGEEVAAYYSSGVQRSIWVEADPGCMYMLIAALRPYPGHIVFNDCCTDKDNEDIVFNISNNEGQSSSIFQLGTHAVVHPEVSFIDSMKMQTTRLDTLLKKNNIDIEQYPFVNMDVQGAELLALKGMGELLNKVKYLYLEVNDDVLYKGCALTHELQEYLSGYGFTMVEKVMAGNFGWGDAFFIKK